jgi:hypothetical protein
MKRQQNDYKILWEIFFILAPYNLYLDDED